MDIDIFQLPGILRRRIHYIVVTALLCIVLAVVAVIMMKPSYSSTAELLLDPAGLSTDTLDVNGSPLTTVQDQSNIDSQIYVMQSRTVMMQVAKNLALDKDPVFAPKTAAASGEGDGRFLGVAEALKTAITIERAGNSLVFSITAKHPDAEKAADIANAVANVYLQQIGETRAEASRRASTSFQIQASELQDRVLKAELAVEKFKSENGLVTAGERGLVIDQQVAGLSDQLTAARVAEEQAQTAYQQVQNLTVSSLEAGAVPEVLQSTSIGLLRDRYSALRDRQTQLAANLGASHPQLRAINSQVADMQRAIQAELDRIRRSLQVNYERAVSNTKALTNSLNSLTVTSFDSGAAQIRMRQLENEAEAVRTLYKSFLSRAEELAQQQSLNTNNSRIITAAVPLPKSSLKLKLLILVAAGLFGTAAGACLAVLREILGGRRFDEKALTEQTGLPVLGHIGVPSPNLKSTARFAFLPARRTPKVPQRRDGGLVETVSRIRSRIEQRRPLVLLFIDAGQDGNSKVVTADIAQALVDLGDNVAYASGRLAENRPVVNLKRVGSPSLAAALGRNAEPDFPLSDLLHFDRFSTPAQPHRSGRPTLAGFVERHTETAGDLVVINGCGTEASNHLERIAAEADAITILVDVSRTSAGDIDQLFDRLGHDENKVLGFVVLDAA